MDKKKKKFVPRKIPRYPVSKGHLEYILRDLREFNKHRYRVYSAKPAIDSKPFKFNIPNYLKQKNMYEDALRAQHIDSQNRNLLKKINYINRKGGSVDCYNPSAYDATNKKLHNVIENKTLDIENRKLYERILKMSSYYDRKEMKEFWEKSFKFMNAASKYEMVIFQKVSVDEKFGSLPPLHDSLDSTSNLYCFLEFQVQNGRKIGYILIELYYELVPITAQNFYDLCSGVNDISYKGCPVHRIKKGCYLETGDITHGNGRGGYSIYGKYFYQENFELKHKYAGNGLFYI